MLPAGATLMREGETADAAYVVVLGRLVVERVDGDRAEVGPGGLVGELALLRGGRRAATVTTTRDTRLIRVGAQDFRDVVGRSPEAAMGLATTLAEEVASPHQHAPPAPPVRTIAVVAAGTRRGRHVARFARQLATALGRFGPTEIVGRRHIEKSVGADAADAGPGERPAAEVAALLGAVEAANTHVVLVGDDHPTPWSSRCVRQADAVVFVGEVDGARDLSKLEREAADGRRRVHLVLLRAGGEPRHASAWLAERPTARHHHVVTGSTADVARVARAVTGRAVGVVLGGGGPRGFAHLGVLKAIEDAGIDIDLIGGTSIGAIFASGIAAGWDHEMRVETAMDNFVRTRFLLRPTLPLVSVLSARKLTRGFLRFFGDRVIEDLQLPYFAISANVSRAEMVVHERGLVWFALRATSSMPGMLPPVHHEGDLLVDGGVVNDLPVDVMRTRTDGPVIAVDLQPAVDLRVSRAFDPGITGLQVLRRRLNPFRESFDVPGPLALLLRAKEVASLRAHRDRLAAGPADLLLRPPVVLTSAVDFKAGAKLIEIGYEYAAAALEGIGRRRDRTPLL